VQVHGTAAVLQARRACESFAAVLWHAGANPPEEFPSIATGIPQWDPQSDYSFEGALANTTAVARADERDEDWIEEDDDDVELEFQFDDVVGYIEDYTGAKAQRRAAHGARRRVCAEVAWVKGEKLKARSPAQPRQQNRILRAGTRQEIAATRRVRMLRQATRGVRADV